VGDPTFNDLSPVVEKEPDLALTTLWVKTSKNEFAAQLKVGKLRTVPDFLNGIRDKLIAQNRESEDVIMEKGPIEKIVIAFWNLGGGIKNPYTLEARTPDRVFTKFRNDLASALCDYREPRYGEEILCFGTVLFEKDREPAA
jgi:hypothetical protein